MTSAHDTYVKGCDFCSIARGDDHAVQIVCQADAWVAFFPLKPATFGHTLVIPRRHVTDIWELDEPLASDLIAAVIRVGKAVEATVHPQGMNLITSKGRAAEQTVFHLHLHVLPRWNDDGFDRIWPTESRRQDANLRSVADDIRAACAG